MDLVVWNPEPPWFDYRIWGLQNPVATIVGYPTEGEPVVPSPRLASGSSLCEYESGCHSLESSRKWTKNIKKKHGFVPQNDHPTWPWHWLLAHDHSRAV